MFSKSGTQRQRREKPELRGVSCRVAPHAPTLSERDRSGARPTPCFLPLPRYAANAAEPLARDARASTPGTRPGKPRPDAAHITLEQARRLKRGVRKLAGQLKALASKSLRLAQRVGEAAARGGSCPRLCVAPEPRRAELRQKLLPVRRREPGPKPRPRRWRRSAAAQRVCPGWGR